MNRSISQPFVVAFVFMFVFSSLFAEEVPFWELSDPPFPDLRPQITNRLEELGESSENAVHYAVELRSKKEFKQWVVRLETVAPPEDFRREQIAHTVLYASSGDKIEFSSATEFLNISTLGPYVVKLKSNKGKWKENEILSHRTRVPRDYLRLGFDKLGEFSLKFQNENEGAPSFDISAAGEPFPEEVIEETKRALSERGITKEHLTPVFGFAPAIQSFFGIIQSTPGISDILRDIVDRPSVFSLITNGVAFGFQGIGGEVTLEDPKKWNLDSDTPCYRIPVVMLLNDKPALEILLIVTSPSGGLEICAGVVGVIVHTPKNRDKKMMVRIIR